MSKRTAEHPPREQLLAYGQGRLRPEAAATLEEHLTECENCCSLLEQTPADRFLSRLRQADPPQLDPFKGDTVPPSMGSEISLASSIPTELIGHPKYRVLGLIGQGGMGAVYRAEHRRMERIVALKVIHPGIIRDPAAVQRFHQEARAAARLHHPNIVSAHDADSAGGLHFLVMEYLEGITLAELIRQRGPLPAAEACEYICQAAEGLQHAHEQGMVHRDIKPHNLMLTGEPGATARRAGSVKILDLGLARLAMGRDASPLSATATGPLTAAGAVMGTADYLAPEQGANPRKADIRADIYSLGCTLFHLLSGQPPFPGGTVTEKIVRHKSRPLPLSRLPRDVPDGVVAVLERMTARNPADRPATPAEVVSALAPFRLAGSGRSRGFKRGFAAALVLLVLGLLLGGGIWYFRPASQEGAPGIVNQPPGPPALPVPPVPKAPAIEPVRMTEKEAIAVVQKLGGRVRHFELIPDNPIDMVLLENTRTSDADLQAIAAFNQLANLDLARTSITGSGLKHLTGLNKLTTLRLFFTKVNNDPLKHLGTMKQLVTLDLAFTQVGDPGMKHLRGLAKLQSLSLSRTYLTDEGMSDVAQLKSLTTLQLGDNRITDRGLQQLVGLEKLKWLDLFASGRISDEGMKSVARLRKLQHLELRGTNVGDRGVQYLAGHPALTGLRLGGPQVSDACVPAIATIPNLWYVDLSRTAVTDAGLVQLGRCPKLTQVDLERCSKVTEAGLAQLRTARPGIVIRR